jgi:hypothetical protein
VRLHGKKLQNATKDLTVSRKQPQLCKKDLRKFKDNIHIFGMFVDDNMKASGLYKMVLSVV